MKNILLIAAREFRHILKMKSFWLTMLLLPALLFVGPLIADVLDDDEPDRIVLIDRDSGQVGETITQSIAMEEDLAQLRSLSRFARRHDLEERIDAVWTDYGREYGPADLAAFQEAGGLDGALARIEALGDDTVPEFEPPARDYEIIDTPPALASASAAEIEEQREQFFEEQEDGAPSPDVILLVDADYAERPVVRLWSNENPRRSLMTLLQGTTQAEQRARMLGDAGLSPSDIAAIDAGAPQIAISTPPPGGGAEDVTAIRSLLPIALAYMLMMSILLSGNWLVQGAVEERSNKLIESVLACVRPQQLMLGKLAGTAAVGLSMTFVWVACAVFVGLTQQGAIAEIIGTAIEPVANVGAVVTILFFYIVGYIALSTLFLGVGVLSDDMNEAQGYLMPIMIVLLLPVSFLLQAMITGGATGIVQAMTWVPPLTPFVVLARLGAGIGTIELIGAGLLLLGFTALMLFLLARLFRQSLLMQGQKKGLSQIVDRFRAPQP
ncbi:ABC transporter permease [Sphingomicrobium sp. XHP0235]|uniref:ABC transporter permease n=1 Tax=Sphingomicrobium aquimarinum TaxID=3133971 RepID=UPI0031FEC2B9